MSSSKRVNEGACANPVTPVNEIDRNICQVCRVKHGTTADDDLAYHWVRCGAIGCDYWVHANCINAYYIEGEIGEKMLANWAKDHMRCKKHQKKPTWDGEKVIKRGKVPKKGDRLKNMIQKVKDEYKK